MSAQEEYTNLECCEANACTDEDDDSFAPISPEGVAQIKEFINDPLLNDNITEMYEFHGDPSGCMIYVGGLAPDNKTFCIYIKNNTNCDTKLVRCGTLMEYVERLAALDQDLFNR